MAGEALTTSLPSRITVSAVVPAGVVYTMLPSSP